MSEVTQILQQIESGDPSAAENLLPLVYDELRRLARSRMAQESPDHTLHPTGLVHEAYLRLVDTERAQHWNSRGHFYSAAAEAMRRILIEHARLKGRLKSGAGWRRIDLSDAVEANGKETFDLLAFDEALQKLERESPRKAELVKLRYFSGLTIEQAAATIGVAPSTANADWFYAKCWLRLEMRADD